MSCIPLLIFGFLVVLLPVSKSQVKEGCNEELCNNLPASCYQCKQTDECTYGDFIDLPCNVSAGSDCKGQKNNLTKRFQCR